jgi:hypothetical protein
MTSTPDQIAVEASTCPRCGSMPGEWCRTKSGSRATWTHAPRSNPMREAWSEGYQEGEYYRAKWALSAHLDADEFARFIRACERVVREWEAR